jgi:hypothetical protein
MLASPRRQLIPSFLKVKIFQGVVGQCQPSTAFLDHAHQLWVWILFHGSRLVKNGCSGTAILARLASTFIRHSIRKVVNMINQQG